MTNRKETQMNTPIPLARLIDMNEVQETPQLAALIMRRLSTEAEELAKTDKSDRALEDHIAFLEETVCELVDLVASLEMEPVERRRLKRIPR